jgi:hypothetical protein
MYEAPKLVRYGKFRDLTLQTPCNPSGGPTKVYNNYDINFPTGQSDGCLTRS